MNKKTFTTKLAKQAGQELKKLFLSKNFKTSLKSKHEIVTSADKIAEKIIIKAIQKNFPEHQILSEEAGWLKSKSDYIWVIDPLDGTTNFRIHNPLFSVSISLLYKKEPILGVIYLPMLNELFVAEKNKGAYLNNKKIKVSKQKKLEDSFLTYCHGSKLKNIKEAIKAYNILKLKSRDCRQLGSAAIELCYVAASITEAIFIPGALRWDVSAGILILREAGGKVTDFENKEWNFNSKNMLATNGQIHNSLLKYLN